TARVPRAPGSPRPGSARHHKAAAVRKRRVTLGVGAGVLVVALGLGGWFAIGDGTSPQDAKQSTQPAP
ncbi:serine/threonine protein kinase, partial [Streptomyces bomunensis]|nr:serine/threonine protein kinase [Streptomyces montanisoli]